MRKLLRWTAAVGAVSLVPAWILVVHPYLEVAAGYSATIASLQHFGTGDSLETIRAERLPPKIGFVELEVDEAGRAVEARALYASSRAVFRPGLGATREETRTAALPAGGLAPADFGLDPGRAWPHGSSPGVAAFAPDVDGAAVRAALEEGLEPGRGTHAVLMAHRGALVFEDYRSGHGRATPLLGWSMTKSVTATLVGRLIHEERLELEAPAPVAEWEADARSEISLDDLLRMRSGLEWHQDHATPFCESLHMLFAAGSCSAAPRAKPLGHAVGERWSYSDGTSNILAAIVLDAVGGDLDRRLLAPRRLLFEPLGMQSAFITVDGAGTFVGSSLMYASARDWARFGQLYLQDGVWEEERLLPDGWVDAVASPTPNSRGRRYGVHFWRIDEGPLEGVFSAQGYQGQFVFIDRERQAVLVRLGVDPVRFDGHGFAHRVLTALPGPR